MARNARTTRRGFSLIEVVLSTATVGVMAVAAMSVAGGAARERISAVNTVRGEALAHAMLDEIAAKPIEASDTASASPTGGASTSGSSGGGLIGGLLGGLLGGGGSGSADTAPIEDTVPTRTALTTVPSYDGWTSTPPRDPLGDPIPGAEGLTRAVTVTEVLAADPAGESAAGTGVYRIEVTVSRGTRVLARAVGVRSREFDSITR